MHKMSSHNYEVYCAMDSLVPPFFLELVSSKAHAAAQTFYADLGLLAQEKG